MREVGVLRVLQHPLISEQQLLKAKNTSTNTNTSTKTSTNSNISTNMSTNTVPTSSTITSHQH